MDLVSSVSVPQNISSSSLDFSQETKNLEKEIEVFSLKFEFVEQLLWSSIAEVQRFKPDLWTTNARLLLNKQKWNIGNLLEELSFGEEKLVGNFPLPVQSALAGGFNCEICLETCDGLGCELGCGHSYCLSCLIEFIKVKIEGDDEMSAIFCPGLGCNLPLDDAFVNLLLNTNFKEKYQKMVVRDFVKNDPSIRWCINPNCHNAVTIIPYAPQITLKPVQCACGSKFCFKCGKSPHEPISCSMLQEWNYRVASAKISKPEDESESWISKNTKLCPRCGVPIEKNDGCDHMTCRQCKHEFCWICFADRRDFNHKCAPRTLGFSQKFRKSLDDFEHLRVRNEADSASFKNRVNSFDGEICDAADKLLEIRSFLMHAVVFRFFMTLENNNCKIFDRTLKSLTSNTQRLSVAMENPSRRIKSLRKSFEMCLEQHTILDDMILGPKWNWSRAVAEINEDGEYQGKI